MKKSQKKEVKKNVFKEPLFILIFSMFLIFGITVLFVSLFGNDSQKIFIPFLNKLFFPFFAWTIYMYLMDCKKYSFLVGFIIALIVFFLMPLSSLSSSIYLS